MIDAGYSLAALADGGPVAEQHAHGAERSHRDLHDGLVHDRRVRRERATPANNS